MSMGVWVQYDIKISSMNLLSKQIGEELCLKIIELIYEKYMYVITRWELSTMRQQETGQEIQHRTLTDEHTEKLRSQSTSTEPTLILQIF